MPKVYLSPSDQSKNTYAAGNTTEEKQCERIATATATALKRCGLDVIANLADGMYTKITQSNEWGADLHVCIHTNAYNEKVSGTRVFCYNLKGEGYKAAQAVFNALAPITPGTSENIKENTSLYEIRMSTAPCVYVEVDFHDVDEVALWIINHVEEIGEAICKGICQYFGVKYVVPKKTTQSGTIYRVQVGAFKVKANADAYLKKVRAAGFPEAYITTGK